mgnify:FL=1
MDATRYETGATFSTELVLILSMLSSLKALQAANTSKAPPPRTRSTRTHATESQDSAPAPPGALDSLLARSKSKAMVPRQPRGRRGAGRGGRASSSSRDKSAEQPTGEESDQEGRETVELRPEDLLDAIDAETGDLEDELQPSVQGARSSGECSRVGAEHGTAGVGNSSKHGSAPAPPPPTLPSHSEALEGPAVGSALSVTVVVESQTEGPDGPITSSIPPMTLTLKIPVIGFEDEDPAAPIFSAQAVLTKLRQRNSSALRIQGTSTLWVRAVNRTVQAYSTLDRFRGGPLALQPRRHAGEISPGGALRLATDGVLVGDGRRRRAGGRQDGQAWICRAAFSSAWSEEGTSVCLQDSDCDVADVPTRSPSNSSRSGVSRSPQPPRPSRSLIASLDQTPPRQLNRRPPPPAPSLRRLRAFRRLQRPLVSTCRPTASTIRHPRAVPRRPRLRTRATRRCRRRSRPRHETPLAPPHPRPVHALRPLSCASILSFQTHLRSTQRS